MWQPCELLYTCYLLTYLLKQHIKSQSTRLCSASYGGCKRDTARICCCAACALLLGARRLLRCAAQQSIDIQWCIAKNGGWYTQTGVAKGLKVPCLFMITHVSIRCQKNPRRLVYAVYPRIPPPNTPLSISPSRGAPNSKPAAAAAGAAVTKGPEKWTDGRMNTVPLHRPFLPHTMGAVPVTWTGKRAVPNYT